MMKIHGGDGMEYNQQQIEDWIVRICNHDECAFQEFYEEWYPKVYYIALAITHHDADAKDAAQETMIEVHHSIHNLRDVKYFKLWLNRIILSKCNRIFRKRKAITMDMEQREALMMKEEDRDEFLPADHMHYQSDVEVMESLLMKMPAIYSQVLVLMYYEQFSIKEIADVLQIPEGTVKSRLNSAKLKLKEAVTMYEQQENIKLSFHEETLGALLILAYQQMADRITANGIGAVSMTDYPKSHSLHKFAKSAAAFCSVACLGLAGMYLMKGNGSVSEDKQAHVPDQNTNFKPLAFRDIPITSEKDAYFVLMKYAHCEVEIAQLNEQEQAIINELLRRIDYKNSVYFRLWEQRNR